LNRLGFGCHIPNFSGINDTQIEAPSNERFDYPIIQEVALLCEELGYDGLWIADHVMLGNRGEVGECWTLLSALAAVTRRIRLGPFVLCDAHRNPALVAKMVATLDNISGGRVDYGIGAGWNRVEQESYGMPWLEKPIERIKRMEEGIEIVKKMWTEDKPSFEGEYYRIKEAICLPKPVQKPHPPIWVAGQGERMLKAVAKYANGWNWFSTTAEQHRKLMDMIRKWCEVLGRNYNDIAISWQGRTLIAKNKVNLEEKIDRIRRLNPRYPLSIEKKAMKIPPYPFFHQAVTGGSSETMDFRTLGLVGTPEEIIERMRQYIDVGVKYFMHIFIDFPSTEGIELFAEKVIPALR